MDGDHSMTPSKTKKAKKGNLHKLMRRISEGETFFEIFIGLTHNPWTEDASKDRTAAIMGATFLEYALRNSISRKLAPDEDDKDYNYLFDTDDAPFREFASRIRLARAMGIINRHQFNQLEIIRWIRNAFAHTMDRISFLTPEINVYLKTSTYP